MATKQLWKHGGEHACNFSDTNYDPVHQHDDGTWWYYDETWIQELGPFDDETACRTSCKLYGDSL